MIHRETDQPLKYTRDDGDIFGRVICRDHLVDSGPIADALNLIASETGLGLADLRDEASFVELGVDSLMSLVLSEKFKSVLNLEIKSSVFLECPSLGDLKEYLNQFV